MLTLTQLISPGEFSFIKCDGKKPSEGGWEEMERGNPLETE